MVNLTRGTVILTSPQQIFLRPQPIFCESFESMNMNGSICLVWFIYTFIFDFWGGCGVNYYVCVRVW